jgi:aminomethyltransferase
MALSWRYSVLADRHRALGSKLEDWNGMGTAWTYAHDMALDHVAIRTRAGLMDVSGLKKLYLVGPHSSAILHYATTRDVTKIYPGKSAYSCMLNDAGHFIEDCILYRMAPNAWMVVHGSGAGHETLTQAVVGRNATMIVDDDLHDLSLQGPASVDFLEKFVPGIRQLKYFHHMPGQLFGRSIMISRTGYSGERGYELFCKAEDAGHIWDTVLAEGKSFGITADVPVREGPTRRFALGARAGLHGEPEQDRLPWCRTALPAQGQGALQDLRRTGRRRSAGRHGR